MRLRLGLALFIFGGSFGCTSPAEHKLPSASITPKLDSRPANAACGDDITLNGDTAPDLRYAYDFDGDGNLTHATGVYTAGGANDSIDYTYDNLDRMTHMLESRGWGDTRFEITADYDTLGELVDYIYDESGTNFHDNWTYGYSQFNAQGEPAREVITQPGQPDIGYTLNYDPDGRLSGWSQDNGPSTTYTYDDAAGTITMDTNNGQWTGVIAYDSDFRELSETYGGSDPSAIATDYAYNWDSDRLLSATYRQSPNNDPAQLTTVEVDTLQYNCAAARQLARQGSKLGSQRLRRGHAPLAVLR